MNIPDIINGAFETTGGVVCWLNVRRLLKDRRVQGVDWRVSAFFASWGFWNLFYYPRLHQWFSFLGGVLLVLTNTTWVALALRTIRRQRHMEHKMFDENCSLCRRTSAEIERIFGLPEIKHTYKCQCDLCIDADKGNIS